MNNEKILLKKLLFAANKLDISYCTLLNRGESELTGDEYEELMDTLIEVEEYLEKQGFDSEFEIKKNKVLEAGASFLESLDEREKTLWDFYLNSQGNLEYVANNIGISPYYVKRILSRIYFKAKNHNVE